ncbi:hypothetical protein A3A46_04585 [Candidatus Roizmanbacteria bacterium RIFCSPLOWO2_01_FULL_37_13]|uniref:O-antigen ligase-related domain-containing protein n=1 Tax=Candidatus Roizmanbacteria bacterium RIFCSPHIGHO2_02_FULL_38_11 TaxID=1802039 RepID=A0A1F7GX87_9BACT|nr:MAG: hypothetical protein A3C25_04735 [Candidatus Roizmanbacteria bacterium RIFCSPHIGHO2_02_FULL_38_11]OGK41180.1 MAG: hypothetical protein A3A46_04585 [Candidatus Roizmanbacteria bacterium RIFCSPLOWO2_01_FULL_37_13]
MIEKILRIHYYLLFFITPLVMTSFTSELFEYNKMMFIYLITLGIIFFWLLKMILYKKIIIKKTPLDVTILFFLGTQILSTVFSIDPHTSFFGYYGRFNGGLISILSFIILYYGFVSTFNSLSEATRLVSSILKISLISSFVVMLWAIPGKLGHDLSCLLFLGQFNNSCWTDQFRPAERIFSTLGQPNWLGAYLTVNFFIGLYFLFRNRFLKRSSLIHFGYLFLNFSSVLFTRSRSALLSVVVGLIAFAIFAFLKNKDFLDHQYKKMLILLLGIFVSIALFKTGIEKIDRFLSISNYYKATKSTWKVKNGLTQQSENTQNSTKLETSGVTNSSDIRKIVWKGALDLGLKYPLFGTGVETFAYSYYFVRPKEHNLTSEWDFLYNKAHNEYLNYFATTGLFGLSSYLVFIISVFIYSWIKLKTQSSKLKAATQNLKIKKDLGISDLDLSFDILYLSLLIAWVTILITNFFGFSTTTINLFFYLIPAFLVVISSDQQLTIKNQQFSISRLSWLQNIMALTLLLVICYLLFGLTKYYLADIKYARGDSFSKIGEYQKAAQLLNDANNLKYEHVYEDKLSYVLANIAFIASYQKENDLAKKMVQTSDELNRRTLKASGKNVLYWKTRAKNYYLFYQITLNAKELMVAIGALQEAKKYSPTDPKIPYSLAIFYSLLEEETKEANKKLEFQQRSLLEIEKSIELKPDYRDGYFLKGQFLSKAGRKNEARKVFNYVLQYLNPNDDEVKKELDSL